MQFIRLTGITSESHERVEVHKREEISWHEDTYNMEATSLLTPCLRQLLVSDSSLINHERYPYVPGLRDPSEHPLHRPLRLCVRLTGEEIPKVT